MKATFKKGTRALHKGTKCKVILTGSGSYLDVKVIFTDTRHRTWVNSMDLELDKEYYRDKKIKRMLDE